jgi:zinc protease
MREKNTLAAIHRPVLLSMLLLSMTVGAESASAALDLRNASVERLGNGLTVILLEDRNFPVASVQMLYRVGARDETTGQTGLAHFLEHMAFRASANYPDTGLVSSIYAQGGEWHGYTWTDQTTYFATVPKEHVDLLLRIEADRMHQLIISADDMEAERGAVLAEMHMYENDPTSMLIDAVMYTSFLGHPYRNNTIGWASDIDNLQHRDVVAFYQRHYHPSNAVLAVVGDIDSTVIRKRINDLFGELPGGTPTALPHTVEPPQAGERRVRLRGSSGRRQFMIAYRAPSTNSQDFAAFLVLQELLGTGSGVNFLQNDWGMAVDDDAVLAGTASELTTWYPPSAQDYIFIIGGSAPEDVDELQIEQALEQRIAATRSGTVDKDTLSAAIEDVLDQLVYDVETTEDAAHQLAFFAGLNALDTLFELPGRVASVTSDDLRRVASRYLQPESRTIAWYAPLDRAPRVFDEPARGTRMPAVEQEPAAATDRDPLPLPVIRKLDGGIPLIVQQSDLSPSAYLQIVLPGASIAGASTSPHKPVLGYSSLTYRLRPHELAETVATARDELSNSRIETEFASPRSDDPETRLEQVFGDIMATDGQRQASAPAPVLIVASGDLDIEHTFTLLNRYFGGMKTQPSSPAARHGFEPGALTVNIGKPLAQARLGYIVPAPAPLAADAYRLLLYILSHDYEGRLGKEAIGNRGLAYYIDGRYRSDGVNGWITLNVGVDPEKIQPLQTLLNAELERLAAEPPTNAEIEEAKAHFAGRALSGAQSNQELAASLAEQWLWYGDTETPEALRRRLAAIGHNEVLDVAAAFVDGMTIEVRE